MLWPLAPLSFKQSLIRFTCGEPRLEGVWHYVLMRFLDVLCISAMNMLQMLVNKYTKQARIKPPETSPFIKSQITCWQTWFLYPVKMTISFFSREHFLFRSLASCTALQASSAFLDLEWWAALYINRQSNNQIIGSNTHLIRHHYCGHCFHSKSLSWNNVRERYSSAMAFINLMELELHLAIPLLNKDCRILVLRPYCIPPGSPIVTK